MKEAGLSSRCAAGAVALALIAGTAVAHDPPKTRVRELVRTQGYRDRSPGSPVARQLVIAAAGRDYEFFATEWQSFEFQETPPGTAAKPEPERVVLQGAPDLVSRFSGARPDQRITLFAERRPGGADLFAIAVDLCPP